MDSGAQKAVYFVSSYHRVEDIVRRRDGHVKDIMAYRGLRTFNSK